VTRPTDILDPFSASRIEETITWKLQRAIDVIERAIEGRDVAQAFRPAVLLEMASARRLPIRGTRP